MLRTTLIVLAALTSSMHLYAQSELDVELAYVWAGYNDVAIPGNTGTRFSLTDDLSSEETIAFRARYGYRYGERHWFGALAAPLSVESKGVLNQDIRFNGQIFSSGTPVESTFRFDSYRLIYRYLLAKGERYNFSIGGALKVRDADITLQSATQSSTKSNLGVVPLLSFRFDWQASDNITLLIDGEALAAPQGRAEDVLFAAEYQANDHWAWRIGYRILEGGADNDEVYTFSLFHYATIGTTYTF